ncbi:unnamed protein product [Rotaria sordida]|uniref:Uncharacterized protein n=1 Tax=Rotaria sordida TaxID=392033 RepID=A0A818TMR1_9BILA|nr:unnamed protein product [Rotaria sordida]CAF1195800.1 unnamed protein product [Rotaria sordida]CAF1237689.1 unnamed protein product [Rotaria sordida]CAF1465071.1 unnamed protein product [Rotaria sordida]CAF3686706.1 unnamed protein product [Rotaria sordida]
MHHHLRFHSFIILVLFNLYCYSSPIPYVDQNKKEQILSSMDSNVQDIIQPLAINKDNQVDYFYILCALYDDCYDKDQQYFIPNDIKPKRLMSNLFHGIPKFGKRAFSSAFSGIPKFG